MSERGDVIRTIAVSLGTLTWSVAQLNAVLSTVLLASNIAFVWWKMRQRKKRNQHRRHNHTYDD